MWALLSTRIRTWLLLAVALPLTRAGVHRLARLTAARQPDSTTARMLGKADSVLASRARGRKRDG